MRSPINEKMLASCHSLTSPASPSGASRHLGRKARLEHVVVVAVAVSAPVHAADDGLAVGDQKLHVVDLMASVVDWIRMLSHPEPVKRLGRPPAGGDRRIGDDTHVGSRRFARTKRHDQPGAAELVHLDQDPPLRRGDALADQREDARVLPQPDGLGAPRARGRLCDRSRRRLGWGTRARQQANGKQQEHEAVHDTGQGKGMEARSKPRLLRRQCRLR